MALTEEVRAAAIQEARICLLAGARVKNSADPSDALLVLLSAPLSELHGSIFSSEKLAELVERHFGWKVSSATIDFFIAKMRSLGWLESRSDFPARGPFYVNLPDPDFGNEGGDTLAALTEVGEAFQTFAKELSPLSALPPEPVEAGALLLKYVVDANLPAAGENTQPRSDEQFIAASYIEYVNKNRLPAKDILASLSAVGYLFRVAEELERPSSGTRKVDLRIVIDGPILLDYLGCSGPVRGEAAKGLFDRLRVLGAYTVTFQHCVDEAREALASVLRTTPRDRYGPTGEALRKGWANEHVLIALLSSFDVAVRQGRIEILPDTLDFMPQSHRFFDDDKAKEVEQLVNWHDSDNGHARYADSDTTVFTIRRRAGFRTSDLFSSKYVCVTTNDVFAGATKRHLLNISYYNSRQVPPVVTLRELSAKLWLEIGNVDREARLSLPNSQLLLTCERALRFNRKVVDKAREELRRVRPEQLQQFEMLLEVPRSARAVMDFTLSNESYVSGDNIDGLVEAAIKAAGEEVGAKAREQRNRDRQKFQEELAAVQHSAEEERRQADQRLAGERRIAEELLTQEKRRADEHAEALRTAEAQKSLAEARAREADHSIVQAIGQRSTERFSVHRGLIRTLSVIIALAPLAAALWTILAGRVDMAGLTAAAVTCLLGAAAAMDRPGAWLSKLICRRIDLWAERRLREMGRDDLASEVELTWSNGVAVASVPDRQ